MRAQRWPPLIDGFFEIVMLLCFAAAWPFSIYRSLMSRSTKGKSLVFMLIVMVGYTAGILNKFVTGQVDHVLYFYFLDLGLVATDALLWIRNRAYERMTGRIAVRP